MRRMLRTYGLYGLAAGASAALYATVNERVGHPAIAWLVSTLPFAMLDAWRTVRR